MSHCPRQVFDPLEARSEPADEDRRRHQFGGDIDEKPRSEGPGDREKQVAQEPERDQEPDNEGRQEEPNPLVEGLLELGNRIGGADHSAPDARRTH